MSTYPVHCTLFLFMQKKRQRVLTEGSRQQKKEKKTVQKLRTISQMLNLVKTGLSYTFSRVRLSREDKFFRRGTIPFLKYNTVENKDNNSKNHFENKFVNRDLFLMSKKSHPFVSFKEVRVAITDFQIF